MKDQCVICCGLIRMIDAVGVSVQEEQDILSDRTSQRHSVSDEARIENHADMVV